MSAKKQKRGSIPRMKTQVEVDFVSADARHMRATKTITRTEIPNLSGMRIEHQEINHSQRPSCTLCGKHMKMYGMCRDCKETTKHVELQERRDLLQDEVTDKVRDGSYRYVKRFDHNIEKGCCPQHADLFVNYHACGMAIPSGLQECEVCV